MTAQSITVTGLTEETNDIVNRLLAQLDHKSRRNLLRSSYYDGKRAIRQISTVVPPHYYRLGIVLGWSAKAVDVLARRCNLDGVVWADGELDDIGYTEFSEANNLNGEVSGAVVSSLIYGACFLINTEGGDNEPDSLLQVKDATAATGDWNKRTRRMENLLSVTDRDDQGNPTGLVLYLKDETVTIAKEGSWRVTDIVYHDLGVPVEALIYKPRPERPFGTSRISRPVMSLHDQALRTVIRMEGHADVFSFPEMWLLGADEGIFKNADGSMKASWQVMLGRIKAIPDDDEAAQPRATVQQFQASSPEPHIAQLKQQAMLFSGETSIPLTSLGVSDMSNPTSADSYIASREDLIAEAEGATDDWTAPLTRAIVRGLAIQNGVTASSLSESWRSIQPKWRSPLHLSRAAQADAGSKQLGAVPWLAETEVGLELLGLDEQQIERAVAERRRLGGSAALRAIVAAAQNGQTVTGSPVMDPTEIKAKAEAMGVLIRSGVDPQSAAAQVGLTGVQFTGAVPVSLRMPTADAATLETA